MCLPLRLALLNRCVTSPVKKIWAGDLPAVVILGHMSRKYGTTFRAVAAQIGV